MNGSSHNERSFERRTSSLFARDSSLRAGEEPPLASHLVSPRAFYNHHGIYAGNGRVIHYAGLAHGLRRGPVEDVSLEGFARGRGFRIRHDLPRFDRREVVERARSRLGERSYHVLSNNCAQFCAWALRGETSDAHRRRSRATFRAIWRALRAAWFGPAGTVRAYQSAASHRGAIAGVRGLWWNRWRTRVACD